MVQSGVVVVVDHEGATGVKGREVVVGSVVVFATRSATLPIASFTRVSKPWVKFRAGLAVMLTGAVMLATSSKILEGRNPAARISGSHLTLIGAITKNLEDNGVEGQEITED